MQCERKNFSQAELLERASLRVAMHIRGMWEEKGSSDTRLLEALFLPDDLTVVGHSHAYTGKGRREHVVPRLVIINECHKMLCDGAADEVVARFIREHVKIVHISDAECLRLDSKEHHNLKQSMPPSWKFGDDIFARLTHAEIKWSPRTHT